MENYIYEIAAITVILFFIYRAAIRFRLSKAKHRSLRGHSKWSRRLSKLVPYFEYSEEEFFRCDGAPRLTENSRKAAFMELCKSLEESSKQSIKTTEKLSSSISDVKFTNAYRVPFPFRKYVQSNLKVANMVEESQGVKIKDSDGNWFYDLTGSYGVNVFGYDFYKDCLQQGLKDIEKLGPVLGQYHPIIQDNVARLKRISGLDEVSFHMSGTEAVMQAVRLARYHTGRSHLVRFCGAYHGWWDGVQPGVGNQRVTNDVYTLSDMSEKSLKVLSSRKDIACVLVNPLQALHPNRDAAGDATLISSTRTAGFDKKSYTRWLQKLQQVCNDNQIVLIFDEVFTGFRLAHHGAAEFFNVQPDMLTYGKTLGGGLPVGVVCGRHELMKRYKDEQPANISFARGTFNSHPMVLACMNRFLKKIEQPEFQINYKQAEDIWDKRFTRLNGSLKQQELPIRIENLMSICTVIYQQPSRYNWMFQFYLRQEKLLLSWVGSGRFIFSHNFTEQDFTEVSQAIIHAATKMKQAGWWWQNEKLTNQAIGKQMLKAMLKSKLASFLNGENSSDKPILLGKK